MLVETNVNSPTFGYLFINLQWMINVVTLKSVVKVLRGV